MDKRKLKNFKGITLIALVITIIILLLLAGITITMLTGENSVLNRAAEAKTKTDEGQKEEQIRLARTEALSNLRGTTHTPRSAAEKNKATDSILLFIGIAIWSPYETPSLISRLEYLLTNSAISLYVTLFPSHQIASLSGVVSAFL